MRDQYQRNSLVRGFKNCEDNDLAEQFDIEVENDKDYFSEIEKISKDLLSNPVIENFKIINK